MKICSLLKYVILWLCAVFYLMLVTVPMRELFIIIIFPPFLLVFILLFAIPGLLVSLVVIAVYYGVKRLWYAAD